MKVRECHVAIAESLLMVLCFRLHAAMRFIRAACATTRTASARARSTWTDSLSQSSSATHVQRSSLYVYMLQVAFQSRSSAAGFQSVHKMWSSVWQVFLRRLPLLRQHRQGPVPLLGVWVVQVCVCVLPYSDRHVGTGLAGERTTSTAAAAGPAIIRHTSTHTRSVGLADCHSNLTSL